MEENERFMDEDEDMPCTSSKNRNRMMISDDDDEAVLEEIDVFVSKKLANYLYILQYPLRPNNVEHRPQPDKVTAQFKPKQKKLELKLEIDSNSKNYDKSRGQQIAINCASAKLEDSQPIFRRHMDYQILSNDNIGGIHSGCYAIAYYKNNALHINPVKDILQLKPNFFYLNAADEKTKGDSSKSKEAGESSQDESDADSSAVQAVRVKFGTEETEAMKKRRVASYSHLQKLQQDEKWIKLLYKNAQEDDSYALRDQLTNFLAEDTKCGPQFMHDSKEIMRLFIPKAQEEQDEETFVPQLPNNAISQNQLRQLPLSDQVEALMTNIKVIKFGQLLTQFPNGVDDQAVIKSLQNCAVLVQGCWVVKSEILFPRHAVSPKSGIGGEILCRARDYCLYKFTQNSVIDRKELTNTLKISLEDLHDILKPLGRLKHQREWHFICPPDADFIKKHADVVQRQNALWDAKLQSLSHHLNLRQRTVSGQSFRSPSRGRLRSGSRSASHSTDTQLFSGEDEKPDINALKFGHASKSPLKNGTRDVSPNNASVKMNNNSNSNIATNNAALGAEFRQFLYEKLSAKPALTLTEIKRLLLLKLAESPPGSVLSKGVSDLLIEQSASELGARKIFNTKMKEPVFAFAGVGSWPDVRRLAIDMLEQKLRIRFKTFKDACASQLVEMPNDADLRKILNDYCTQKNSYYSLAGM